MSVKNRYRLSGAYGMIETVQISAAPKDARTLKDKDKWIRGDDTMNLFIDNADISAIRHIYEYYPVDGVSTNPTLLSRTGRAPFAVLREIRDFIGADELFVQAVSPDAAGMVREARRIVRELGEETLIKIPAVPEGYKAMKELEREGIRFIGTAVYTVMQGFIAAKCGAEYVAPYVNRIDSMGFDGVQVALDLQDAIDNNGLDSGLIAASFRNTQQVMELIRCGVKSVTVSPEVFAGLTGGAMIDAAVEKFSADFASLTGKGVTMENCD